MSTLDPQPADPTELRERTITAPRFPEGTDPWLVAWITARRTERELSDLVVRVHNGVGKDRCAEVVALVRALDPPHSPEIDDARGYLRLDWTLRQLTPTLLEAAGVAGDAATLLASDPVEEDASALALSGPLHHAMTELSTALATLNRRLLDDGHQPWAGPAEAAARDTMWWSGESAA